MSLHINLLLKLKFFQYIREGKSAVLSNWYGAGRAAALKFVSMNGLQYHWIFTL